EIFEESGEAGFRAIETEVAIELAKENNKIIATGGGTIKNKINMDYLRQNGITIFIDRDINKLISADPNRPLSKSKDALQQLHDERYHLYQKYAAYIAVNNTEIEETVNEIEDAYRSILMAAITD
ncbi:MAG: shikimate kinase, partial [Longicatena sp.]